MGSICYICSDPKLWNGYETGQKLREEYGGEALIKVSYGTLDDYPEVAFPLEMLQTVKKGIQEPRFPVK